MAVKKVSTTKPSKGFFASVLRPNRNLASLSLLLVVVLFSFLFSLFFSKNLKLISEELNEVIRAPKYWHVCNSFWNKNGQLRTMDRVFERIGYEFVNASNGDDWDVMWSFEYSYDGDIELFEPIFEKPLKHHQRLNHIPGIAGITNKLVLTTENRDLKFILPTFEKESIAEFKNYVEKNPEKKFVEKNIWNRGVKVIDKEKIDFEAEDKMFQVFMDKPMLIDDRAFDMGIYVLISSINPLRVYRYDAEMLLRFCPEPYYPFNASNVNQYVVFENHKHYSELPSFKKYADNLGYSLKHIYEDYLREKGLEPAKLWKQVDEIISTVVARNEDYFIEKANQIFSSTHQFFELVRFDFIIDADFNLYLMEVNLSPNITPTSAKYERNAIVREKMVYDAVNLVGAGSYFDLKTRYNSKAMKMISNLRDIAVNLEICVDDYCKQNCHEEKCGICFNCLSEEDLQDFHEAYREHGKRGGFKRVFPTGKYVNESFIENLSVRTIITALWFEAKCRNDQDWC